MEKTQEISNKDLQELKSKQTMMKKYNIGNSNSLEGIKSRITETEEWRSDLEDKIVEITTAEQDKEKRMKRIEDTLRDFWNNIKHTNIQIIRVPEEEEKKKELRKYLKRL